MSGIVMEFTWTDWQKPIKNSCSTTSRSRSESRISRKRRTQQHSVWCFKQFQV